MTHLICSSKKLGRTFKLQKDLLKTEMDHDEFVENNCGYKRKNWLPHVKNDVLCTALVVLDVVKLWKKSLILE